MRGNRLLSVGLAATLICGVAAAAPRPAKVPESRTIRNLHAFVRLYGYVRWFHPSDEAAATDWDAFAVLGARRVRDARDDIELRRSLVDLFTPIAPTVLVFPAGKAPAVEHIAAPADSPWVAWQHLGAGYGASMMAGYSPYKSLRVNRDDGQPRAQFGTVTNGLEAVSLRGRAIRLRSAMRAEVTKGAGTGQMWLRVDRPNQQMGFFDNMDNRPVTSAEWSEPEIVGTVDPDAVSINYGAFLAGNGVVEVDDFRLEAKKADGSWESIPLANGGFEQGSESTAPGWYVPTGPYVGTVVKQGARQGAQMMRITSSSSAPGPLFTSLPRRQETIDAELVSGLHCRVRLSLPSVHRHTQPEGDVMKLGRLRAEIDAERSTGMTVNEEAVRVAGVATAWNVIQHFWPYFDVVRPDWDGALDRALARAVHDRTGEEHAHSLRLMTSLLEDGHVNVSPVARVSRAWTPLNFAWAEGRMVVTESGDSLVRRGDIVRAIDGRDVTAKLDSIMATRSGTERWRRHQALRLVDRGDSGSVARLQLERGSGVVTVNVPRATRPVFPPRTPDAVAELEPGIWYVDLERSRMSQVDSVMTQLAGAKGVIFDGRGYPNGTHPVLNHLSDQNLQSAIWRVPRVVRPDHRSTPEWEESGRWNTTPLEPRIRGKAVFLIGAGAISYAESVLGMVEFYHLGELVGEATAGTNGNINQFNLPGGLKLVFTGMRVVKNDGSEHMGTGIRPTVPVTRTIAGIRDGRDEVLDRGLQIVRAAVSPK